MLQNIRTAIGEFYPFEHAANLSLDKFSSSEESVLKALESFK
jgi:hypothetical protein